MAQDYDQLRKMTLVLEGQIEVRLRVSHFIQSSHKVCYPQSSSMHILPDATVAMSDELSSKPWLRSDEESEGDEWHIGEPPSTPTAATYLGPLSYASALRPFDSSGSSIAPRIVTRPLTDVERTVVTYPCLPAPRGRVITGGLVDRKLG